MPKKIISIILALSMLFGFTVIGFAEEDPRQKASDYPFIFVHGMLGWGENTKGSQTYTYWGMSEEKSILNYFKSKGLTVYAPSVGPMSSAWDRACELYAQLTGTRVDYGAAHSEKYGHERYGRDYTGKGFLSENWYETDKINLISHSFGGPTVTIFTYLMTTGSQEEIEAAPDDCSELFKGNHDCIFSVNTLESPHNGSPLSNLMCDTVLPIYFMAFYMNLQGTKENPTYDFMLDQWGLSCDPDEGTVKLNLKGILNIAKSNDHAGYDMTIGGAKELEKYTPSDKVYYFSFAADMTEEGGIFGRQVSSDNVMSFFSNLIILMANHKYNGIKIDKSWQANDGMVPVPSALYPNNAENCHEDYVEGMDVQTGIWYVMPLASGQSHGYGVSGSEADIALYDGIIARLDGISRVEPK